MNTSGIFALFAVFQIALDLYIGGLVIYWVIQRRRYGTFNPLSPFQHRELQSARELLNEFKNISQKTAALLQKVQNNSTSTAARRDPEVTAEIPAPVFLAPAAELKPVAPANLPERTQKVRLLLRQGLPIHEIRRQTGASQEEIHLLQAIQ